MEGSHQPERAATTDLPNQINYVCMHHTVRSYKYCMLIR